ncbi:Mo25-like [Trypanosoma melophagium]|uniref:Mo25-like n=1 Tax=Trypanosoma melophagium TaxID=715481 RepID=UPI00351A0D22|nr:Mo25-like [Trypanosoma melophagium]
MSAAALAEDGIHTSKGFLRVLQTSDKPATVNAALLLLLQTLSNPTEEAVSLSPVSLRQLLRLLVERTDDAWLEVRKKIAFVFGDLILKGHGDVLADALLYGEPQNTSTGEALASHIDFDSTTKEEINRSETVWEMKGLLGKLAEAHGTVERCVPAADVFRTLMRVPVFLEMILSPSEITSTTTNTNTDNSNTKANEEENVRSSQQQEKHYNFCNTCIGILCRSVGSDTTVLCTETWLSLNTALQMDKGLSASLLLYYFNEFVLMFKNCLDEGNFVAKLHALELLASILEDSAFLKARRSFAESPALLCALLPLTNSSSTHIRFLTFDALKVFIAKGNKPAPIRYILFINREILAAYVEDYSTEEVAIQKRLELEKQRLLQSLTSLEPLTHEEELLLGVK